MEPGRTRPGLIILSPIVRGEGAAAPLQHSRGRLPHIDSEARTRSVAACLLNIQQQARRAAMPFLLR